MVPLSQGTAPAQLLQLILFSWKPRDAQQQPSGLCCRNQAHLGRSGLQWLAWAQQGCTTRSLLARAHHNPRFFSPRSRDTPYKVWDTVKTDDFCSSQKVLLATVVRGPVVWLLANKPKGTRAPRTRPRSARVCPSSFWSSPRDLRAQFCQKHPRGRREHLKEGGGQERRGAEGGRAAVHHQQPGFPVPLTMTNWAAATACGSEVQKRLQRGQVGLKECGG